MTGLVFDIKEMAIFDGPGIRTTVFLKGCPLRCQWCHNPEGISPKVELMVKYAQCIKCGACVAACPTGAVHSLCTTRGECISVCPLNLRRLVGESYTPQELATFLLKHRPILEKNGGGVTFSGGEPLLQSSFLLATIKHLEGLHCAVETSGFASKAKFKEVVEHLDYVLMDLKMVDSEKHRYYCGEDNRPILENLKYLKGSGKPFVIRIPVIPGVNDNDENYRETAKLLEGSLNLEKVELLPYQRTAGAKYGMVGRHYLVDFDEDAKPYFNLEEFTKRGIEASIL
ncbi:MAG: glycyl-radical enzyme activating protein [Sphaerochaetaceae bacterium]|jgi:pyruvate formate lyase activating enzyme|nr:glycyl-radical enzyme activating protein [Sphaerochaetaceae bacterium]HHU88021.1 glycyl-radical enzyme activating protein [Spirochaetales bacterium]